jgi:cytochrome o ubiquinol oxidase subunit IV
MKPYISESYPDRLTYLTGFMLALILTVLAFGLVYVTSGKSIQPIEFVLGMLPHSHQTISAMPHWFVLVGINVLAVLQIAVHLRYFLHLGFNSRQRLNVLVIVFSLFIIFIMVFGTLWIMHDLSRQMLPDSLK